MTDFQYAHKLDSSPWTAAGALLRTNPRPTFT